MMPPMDDEQPHILVVDDDRRLSDLLKRYLAENGFRVTTASDALEARHMLRSLAFDALVLDVMMPGESGLSFAESLRQASVVPILMLSAMGEPEDRIAGLEHGADDYLSKPFEPRELLLRLQTILRRSPGAAQGEVVFGACRFDPEKGNLLRSGERIKLTESETRLLGALVRRNGEAVARDTLNEECGLEGGERAVDVLVTRLRRKIEDDPRDPHFLRTIRGKGYALVSDI
jgi:two-component system phosphate regulon response regulator OmpR